MTRATPDLNPLIYLALSQCTPTTMAIWEGTAEKPGVQWKAMLPDGREGNKYQVIVRGQVVHGKLNDLVQSNFATEQFDAWTAELASQLGRKRRVLKKEALEAPGLAADVTEMCIWLESTTEQLRQEREQNEERAAKQQEDFFTLLARQTNRSEEKAS
jgi:hypothetical protein